MSVIIEGMVEPESCEFCEFAMWSNLKQAFVCKVNRKAISGSYCDVRKKKPGWCPITELTKKTGRISWYRCRAQINVEKER